MSFMNKRPLEIKGAIKECGDKVYLESNDIHDFEGNPYHTVKMLFSVGRLYQEGNKVFVEPDTNEFGCREQVAGEYFLVKSRERAKEFSLDFASVIILGNASLSNIKEGLRVLNHYERKARWGASFVVPTDNRKYLVVVGSKYWFSTPLHMSLWLLLIRLVSDNKIASGQTVLQYIKYLITVDSDSIALRFTDRIYLKEILQTHKDFIQITMKHVRKLQGGFILNESIYEIGEEGVNFFAEFAENIAKIKTKYKGDAQTSRINLYLGLEEHLSYDTLCTLRKKDGIDYGDYCACNSTKKEVLILADLLMHYVDKRVS